MKSAVALACVLFLVCGAQARAIEDDIEERGMIKDKLKHFIDYLESQVQPSLHDIPYEIWLLVRGIKIQINQTIWMGDFLQDTINKTFQEIRATELHGEAVRLEVDTSECDQKTDVVMSKFFAYRKDLEYCARNTEPRYNFIKDSREAIDKLKNASIVIENHAKTAKKCVEDATLFSSVSAAKCLVQSILAAELAWLETPKYTDLIVFYDRYDELCIKIEDCLFIRTYVAIKAEAEKVREEVNDCISELIEAKKKEENQSSGN